MSYLEGNHTSTQVGKFAKFAYNPLVASLKTLLSWCDVRVMVIGRLMLTRTQDIEMITPNTRV